MKSIKIIVWWFLVTLVLYYIGNTIVYFADETRFTLWVDRFTNNLATMLLTLVIVLIILSKEIDIPKGE